MTTKQLPAEFTDLGRFADKWILPGEAARHRTRLNSSFEEVKDLYDTLLPRMDGIITHLNHYKLGEMPEKETNLMGLAFSFMEVTAAVERFKRAGIRGFDPTRFNALM